MDQKPDFQQDLASIRQMMERSSKFISLSGLSGILAGIYALAGAITAYLLTREFRYSFDGVDRDIVRQSPVIILTLGAIAAIVLIMSLATGIFFSSRKAKAHGTTLWTATSFRIIINLAIPLVAGGMLILIQLYFGNYEFVAPGCLVFYGLALLSASPNLFEEVRYLGYSEILLGLVCAALPGYGLFFWAVGFGIFHIFYGALMFRKYDR